MIRNAVIHLAGKLPVLADLHGVPAPTDVTLLARNVRTRDGKRPTFVEDTAAWFVIPLHEVTVIELPSTALEDWPADTPAGEPSATPPPGAGPHSSQPAPDTTPLEPDEELLARIREV